MRLTESAAFLLATTANLLAGSPTAIAVAQASQCPGGAEPDREGRCPNPDFVNDGQDDDDEEDEESSSSSDDAEGGGRGNPHAHNAQEKKITCQEYIDLSEYVDATYETKSFFQELAWTENPAKPDICMSLDDILQICQSYRPHYHEPFVHFPAAYLKDFKRVVFIGGGDSMLLHESLKYPNVELVLGLELDQKVVRESLKHFHTKPHFDNPKVQWWFGDAAKSLALIPREWFGTFDLVMVDLSETAMSISVNDDLDIFGALSLLMKPDGIFVKNELYYKEMSKLFDHSIQVYMTDCPMLCDQDWAMGSNKIDFLHPKIDGGLVDVNEIQTLEYTPLEDNDEHYKLIKDYSRNNAREQGKCADYDKEVEAAKAGEPAKKEPVKPTRASGVMLVVEAENVTELTGLESAFKKLLEAQGLTPLGQTSSQEAEKSGEEDNATTGFFIAMEEGYLDAHIYPSKSYVGLEISLWSKIAKHDDIRRTLLDAMGVDMSYSSYRVIHGGMHGAKNWKEDVEAIGPVKKSLRNCDEEALAAEPQVGEGLIPTETYNNAVISSLVLLPRKMDKVVAVICGTKGIHPCATVEALKNSKKVDSVVALWSCDKEADNAEKDDSEIVKNVNVCDSKGIKRSAQIEEGYSALVVDPVSPPEFTRQISQMFCNQIKQDRSAAALLRAQASIMTPLSNVGEKHLFDICIARLNKDMIRSSKIVLDKTAEYGIIGAGNPGFVRNVVDIAEKIESTGVRTMIGKMVGGPVQNQLKYDPEHYPGNVYEERDALRQYTNQIPLASQSLYQLQVENKNDAEALSVEAIKKALDAVVSKSTRFANAKRVDFSGSVGDGSINVAILADCHVIVTWDGYDRVTLNTLTSGERYERVPPKDPVPDMVLVEHRDEVLNVFMSELPKSAKVAVREQMPRGANRAVNFKKDIFAIPGCTDFFDLCAPFARDGDCDDAEDQKWMHTYCALSCGTCDEMKKLL